MFPTVVVNYSFPINDSTDFGSGIPSAASSVVGVCPCEVSGCSGI